VLLLTGEVAMLRKRITMLSVTLSALAQALMLPTGDPTDV